MSKHSITITMVRVCEHCGDGTKEAFPYGVHDRDGKYWEILCNECFDVLGERRALMELSHKLMGVQP